MYEKLFIVENKNYGDSAKTEITAVHPRKGVILHNSSTEHITITVFDTNIGSSVEVTIRKEEVPDWIKK